MALAALGTLNDVTSRIIDAAIEVHRHLGAGLLESAYQACLEYELQQRAMAVERQKPLPLRYNGTLLDCGYRMDLLVNGCVVVEVKSVAQLAPIHEAQMLTYLRLTGHRAGLLLNFNVPIMKRGIRRLLNGTANVRPEIT